MTFDEFNATLPALRVANPGALDMTETRAYRALAPLAETALGGLHVEDTGYRCHVAQAWHERLGLAEPLEQVLVSKGVRHALGVLFRLWAAEGRKVAMPADVFPTYLQLARDAGLTFTLYPTQPSAARADFTDCDVVLAANPVSPRATSLSPVEALHLEAWAVSHPDRLLVVDAVYDLSRALAPATRRLFATGQAVVLYSLSKAWLAPLRAGAVLVPRALVGQLTEAFRAEAVDRTMLAQAHALLTRRESFPLQVREHWAALQAQREPLLRSRGMSLSPSAGAGCPSYLFCIQGHWQDVLRAGVLGRPLSVWGSTRQDVTVISTLAPV